MLGSKTGTSSTNHQIILSGFRELRNGRLHQAERHLLTALSAKPFCDDARLGLGMVAQQKGFPEKALKYFLGIINSGHPNVNVYIQAINSALSLKDDVIFARLEKKALQEFNDSPQLLNHIALINLNRSHINKALELLIQAIAFDPESELLHNNLGNAYRKLGALSSAIKHYDKAKKSNPQYMPAYINSGATLYEDGKFRKALKEYKAALELDPTQPIVLKAIADVLMDLNEPAEAVRCLKQAVNLAPNNATYHQALARGLIHAGDQSAAVASLQQAICVNPSNVDSYLSLAKIGSKPNFNKEIELKLFSFLKRPEITTREKSKIFFTLGMLHDQKGNTKEAFRLFTLGNKFQQKNTYYNKINTSQQFEKLRETFSKSEYKLNSTVEPKSVVPIFIVGMPRSGTTLLEQIFSSHSSITGAGELQFGGKGVVQAGLSDGEYCTKSLAQFRQYYLSRLAEMFPSAPFVTDKMPYNFRWIGCIKRAIPEAKIIEIVRSPEATCFSIFKNFFAQSGNEFSNDFNDIVHYYGEYRDLMDFWHGQFHEEILRISYEALTANPEKEVASIFDKLRIPFEVECLDPSRNRRPVKTNSSIQIREGIYKGSSDDWLKYEKYLYPMKRAIAQLSHT